MPQSDIAYKYTNFSSKIKDALLPLNHGHVSPRKTQRLRDQF